jgi:hypothetical protein
VPSNSLLSKSLTHRLSHDTLLDRVQTWEQDLNRRSVQLHPLRLRDREPLLGGDPPRTVVELIEPRGGIRPDARALALEHKLPSHIDPAVCVPPDISDRLHERDVALLDDFRPSFVPTRQAGDELDLKQCSVSCEGRNWEGGRGQTYVGFGEVPLLTNFVDRHDWQIGRLRLSEVRADGFVHLNCAEDTLERSREVGRFRVVRDGGLQFQEVLHPD